MLKTINLVTRLINALLFGPDKKFTWPNKQSVYRFWSKKDGRTVVISMHSDKPVLSIVFQRPIEKDDMKDGRVVSCTRTTRRKGKYVTELVLSLDAANTLSQLINKAIKQQRKDVSQRIIDGDMDYLLTILMQKTEAEDSQKP